MKCFYYFKDRNKSRVQKSAPVLNSQSKSDISETDRVTKSSCSATSPRSIPELYEEKAQNLRVFTFSELRQATNNFSRLLKIGEGGFGCVYKGTIKSVDGKGDPLVVAIKKLNRDGYQIAIVLGAAQGLAYLHEELEIQVIYRDFKSSNVLLDDDFKPKLSDFGLAREGPTAGHTHVSTAVVGTYGYAAPDYIETGHLTSKSDVWSFGVVLYEILTGRRSLERDRPRSEQKLLEWIKQYPADGRKFAMIMDPRLENKYSLNAARKIAKLADSCLVKSAKDRPKMSKVVETLKQIVQVSGTASPPTKFVEDGEDKMTDEKPAKQMGSSESAKRRMAHLAKISEHIGGVSRRRFMIMQRAKVT
ncbi:UNVERIFIED_CONTAM: putative serine/threonine-protein kinase PBL19 [Sesamum calycinum]|uniref:Serine/threonine-protein kinase PBL19 n=1 Tax=Sesamum calycinum TaxID=2727403 RepID=A0AAW2NSJ5_9LAMI